MKPVGERKRDVEDVLVVIPVHRRPELIREALQSVRLQSHPPSRIVCVIDSLGEWKTKDCEAVETSYGESGWYPNTRLEIRLSPERGPASARNLGVADAEETWLAFLDSDDLWEPGKLGAQLSYLKQRPHLHGCQTGETWIKDGKILSIPERLKPGPGRFLRSSLDRCLISPSSVLLRRSLFQKYGGFDESFPSCEDYELWIRLLMEYPMGYLEEKLTVKRSGGWPQLSGEHSLDALRIEGIIKNYPMFDRSQQERAKEVMHKKMHILDSGAARRSNEDSYRELKKKVQRAIDLGSDHT